MPLHRSIACDVRQVLRYAGKTRPAQRHKCRAPVPKAKFVPSFTCARDRLS
jgi:hypothetical protein